MPSERQRIGGLAEDQAVFLLEKKGFAILARHVTSRFGEIDILARDGETIVAVEVKARRTRIFGTAVEAVTDQKLEKIAAVLHEYIELNRLADRPIRIDVITIQPSGIDHVVGVEAPQVDSRRAPW